MKFDRLSLGGWTDQAERRAEHPAQGISWDADVWGRVDVSLRFMNIEVGVNFGPRCPCLCPEQRKGSWIQQSSQGLQGWGREFIPGRVSSICAEI